MGGVLKIGEDLLLGIGAATRQREEIGSIDAVRDHIYGRETWPDPLERMLELCSGKLGINNYAIRVLQRPSRVFVCDFAVERDVSDDLQTIAVGSQNSKIVLEHPDIVENEYQLRLNLLD